MDAQEMVRLTGQVIDTGQLARVLDVILDHGADYELRDLAVGRSHDDETSAIIVVRHHDRAQLDDALVSLVELGVEPVVEQDAEVVVTGTAASPRASRPRPTPTHRCASTAAGSTWTARRWKWAS